MAYEVLRSGEWIGSVWGILVGGIQIRAVEVRRRKGGDRKTRLEKGVRDGSREMGDAPLLLGAQVSWSYK